jgi:hypothetical protein
MDEEQLRSLRELLLDESSALRPNFRAELAGVLGRNGTAALLASWSQAKWARLFGARVQRRCGQPLDIGVRLRAELRSARTGVAGEAPGQFGQRHTAYAPIAPLVHVEYSANRPKRPEQGGDNQPEVDGEQLDDASNCERQGRVLSGGNCDYLAGLLFCRKLLASSCASCPDGSV